MKTTFVRGFVLFLALTGFGATTASSASASVSNGGVIASVGVVTSPTPLCPPNDPNACGLD